MDRKMDGNKALRGADGGMEGLDSIGLDWIGLRAMYTYV